MPWKRMTQFLSLPAVSLSNRSKWLALVTGEIEETLLHKIEYLTEENRVLRRQIRSLLLLNDGERKLLAEKAVLLGKLTCPPKPHAKEDG